MDKSFISSEEVCKILDACAKKGVIELKFGPLEVRFQPKAQSHPKKAPGPIIPAHPEPENILQEQREAEKAELLREEIRTKEDEVDELVLTDPLKYEELIESGELSPSDFNEEPMDGDDDRGADRSD